MTSKHPFFSHIMNGYAFNGETLTVGAATIDQKTLSKAFVKIPLKTLNRHGLISGATGTGKTKNSSSSFRTIERKRNPCAADGPQTTFFDIESVLTSLGIGEALVTAIDEKGRPTPLTATMMRAPKSRMDILTQNEIKTLFKSSKLAKTYNIEIDRESAYEILNKKIKTALDKSKKKPKNALQTHRDTNARIH